jgi:formylmethanofuran dehydrogenase subunit E
MEESSEFHPIGVIHSPYKCLSEAPYQGSREGVSEIEIFSEYEDGLKDIEGFSHLIVLCWFHKSQGYSTLVNTPWDTIPHGVFATRSPRRPNPIGLSVVELLERNRNLLRVRGLDAIEKTPVLDIKPYTSWDAKEDISLGWLKGKGHQR